MSEYILLLSILFIFHDIEYEDSSRACTYSKQEDPVRQSSVDTAS